MSSAYKKPDTSVPPPPYHRGLVAIDEAAYTADEFDEHEVARREREQTIQQQEAALNARSISIFRRGLSLNQRDAQLKETELKLKIESAYWPQIVGGGLAVSLGMAAGTVLGIRRGKHHLTCTDEMGLACWTVLACGVGKLFSFAATMFLNSMSSLQWSAL